MLFSLTWQSVSPWLRSTTAIMELLHSLIKAVWWRMKSIHLVCLCRRWTSALESPSVWKLNGIMHVQIDHSNPSPSPTNYSIFWRRCFCFISLCCSTGLQQHPWDQLLKGYLKLWEKEVVGLVWKWKQLFKCLCHGLNFITSQLNWEHSVGFTHSSGKPRAIKTCRREGGKGKRERRDEAREVETPYQ